MNGQDSQILGGRLNESTHTYTMGRVQQSGRQRAIQSLLGGGQNLANNPAGCRALHAAIVQRALDDMCRKSRGLGQGTDRQARYDGLAAVKWIFSGDGDSTMALADLEPDLVRRGVIRLIRGGESGWRTARRYFVAYAMTHEPPEDCADQFRSLYEWLK